MTPEMLEPPALEAPLVLAPEDHPNIDDLETEDGKPSDSSFQEKLHRLLTESLFASWPEPGEGRPFLVLSNAGLFFATEQPPLVPDIMFRLDVPPRDLRLKENRSYFTWIVGKPPNVVIEFVSDERGNEATTKLTEYADIGVTYYTVFDPKHELSSDTLQIDRLVGGVYQRLSGSQLDGIGLGLVLWRGKYEEAEATWLRWCDTDGVVIPTGKERADEERRRADEEQRRAEELEKRAGKLKQRADKLAARLRELGIDPDTINGI